MIVVRESLGRPPEGSHTVQIMTERHTLAKRRWRGVAEDGTEFGFDLERPLHAGDMAHIDGAKVYVIVQTPEPVLEIPLLSVDQAARTAWQIGNLHFPLAFTPGYILVEDDPAIRQMVERERIPFHSRTAVLQPFHASTHRH